MRTSVVLALLLAPVLATACADPGPPPETFDPCTTIVLVPPADASAAERASIDAAIGLWRERAGVAITTDEVPGAPRVGVLFRSAPLAFLGVYERETVVINRDLDDSAARTIVVAHELGHAFGLVHVSDRSSVMVAGNFSVPPGATDEQALATLWGACR